MITACLFSMATGLTSLVKEDGTGISRVVTQRKWNSNRWLVSVGAYHLLLMSLCVAGPTVMILGLGLAEDKHYLKPLEFGSELTQDLGVHHVLGAGFLGLFVADDSDWRH